MARMKQILIWIIGITLVLGVLKACTDGISGKTKSSPTTSSTLASTTPTTPTISTPSIEGTLPTSEDTPKSERTRDSTSPTPAPTEGTDAQTSEGIGFSDAAPACDRAAQRELWPGRKFKSHTIAGIQKVQRGLEENQLLVVYNVTLDKNYKVGLRCLVDGTKGNVNVITVSEDIWN